MAATNKVRFSSLAGAVELMREFGVDPVRVFKEADFPLKFINDNSINDFVEYDAIERLLEVAADRTDCAYFGVLLGNRQDLNVLGLLGYVMQQAPDVRTALQELIDHTTMQIPSGARLEVETAGDYSSLLFHVTGGQPVVKQTNELAISECNRFLKILCGHGWAASSVHFTHKEPSDISPYQRFFGKNVKFNQEENRVIFHTEVLKKSIDKSNAELHSFLKTHQDLLQNDNSIYFSERVEQIIRRTLPTGRCSVEHTADLLSINRRTLCRRLKLQSTSFSEILENTRKNIASERLSNSNMTIVQLAQYLGYSDNSAFTRSFKCWYNITPRQWRNKFNK